MKPTFYEATMPFLILKVFYVIHSNGQLQLWKTEMSNPEFPRDAPWLWYSRHLLLGLSLASLSRRRPWQPANLCSNATLCDRKAKVVIKNAPTLEETQQDSADVPLRHWRNTTQRRTLWPILRRRLTRSTAPLGTALWGRTSAVTGHMKANASSTSTWAEWPFFCSNLVKVMDGATRSVIHPQTKAAA